MKTMKILTVVILAVLFAVSAASAASPSLEDVQVEEKGGDYYAVVTFSNEEDEEGVTELSMGIDELGVKDEVEYVEVSGNTSSTTRTYPLKDEISNFEDMSRGESYTLKVSTEDDQEMSKGFLFKNVKDTDGLDAIMEDVKIDSTSVADDDVLQVENGETVDVDLRMFAQQNIDDARFRVFIEGYEHDTLMSSTEVMSMEEGKTYTESLNLDLPDDMDSEKEYKLRIEGANDLSGLTYKEYDLYVDTQRHRVDVEDYSLTPSSGVEPGQNVISNVRVENNGQKSQDTVRVSVEVPELGIESSSFVSDMDSGDTLTSDDMMMKVPDDADAGSYEGTVKLSYNDGYDVSEESFDFEVVSPEEAEEEDMIVSHPETFDLTAGESDSFEVVVGNPTDSSKPISVAAKDNSWADVSITPTLGMVSAGEDAAFKVDVTPKSSVSGEKELEFDVKEESETLSTFKVDTYVEEEENGVDLVNALLIGLIALAVVILLMLVIAIARKGNSSKNDEEEMETEEYY